MVEFNGSTRGNVAEVFRSVQGEGLLLGRRQVFVRLAGCTVDCQYCDTAWAFNVPDAVRVPGDSDKFVPNPMTAEQVVELVNVADPHGDNFSVSSVSLTGGEPLEQAAFCVELAQALAPRHIMLETAALDVDGLTLVAPHCRWIAADFKLPTPTGSPHVFDSHERVFESGVLNESDVFFKIVVDGATPVEEVGRAADLLFRYFPHAPVFLQPVTPLGTILAVSPALLESFLDQLAVRSLDARVVPQVHKVLKVR